VGSYFGEDDIERFEDDYARVQPAPEKSKGAGIVCVSGYFDPLHVGHIEYFEKAREIGASLVVIVNNDDQAVLKKGKSFMPADERVKVIEKLRCVDAVVLSVDTDRTVCQTLAQMEPKPSYFCNGGDQNNATIPEGDICAERGIELRDGFGEKIQSSSWLTDK